MMESARRWTTLVTSMGAIVGLGMGVAVASSVPDLPSAEVLLLGDSRVTGEGLDERQGTYSMARVGETEGLTMGEKVPAGAIQATRLELVSDGGREVLRRTSTVRRAGSDDVLMVASIDMDPATLAPLVARTERGGESTTIEYDWATHTVRAAGSEGSVLSLDLPMLEVGAHDVWMAALPLREGFVARLPAVFAATGTKYWAVPKVVGSEPVDLGDGEPREAWVVELDWWGMGADNTIDNHSRGGGADGTAGPGGKYWVLKDPPEGLLPVVRIRTEIDPETDSVLQVQGDT